MTREQAALVLGVDSSATDEQINHAWRVWAKLAHPDAGGDRDHFEALAQARAVLLRRTPDAPAASCSPDEGPQPVPRAPLRSVIQRPSLRGSIGMSGVLVTSMFVVLFSSDLTNLGAASAAGIASSIWASVVQRCLLDPAADVGHRITVSILAWIPLVTLLVAGMSILGVDLIGLLPVVALPFAVVVASVNPGAGLWRPIRLPS